MSDTLTHDELAGIKQKQQATWSSGDYAVIGTTLQIIGESLCEAVDIDAGSRVLDVAAGNGNASLAAARRGAHVLATDYVPELLERAAFRAEADGLPLRTQVADAEALPFEAAEFDAVLSTLGVMFTPNPPQAAAELVRVCKPGGKIGLANWTPAGFVGQMFKIVGAHVPPPAGVSSPLLWGTPDRIHELFAGCADIAITEKTFAFRFTSSEEYFEVFRTYYGPLVKASAALDDAGRQSLHDQLVGLGDAMNRSTTGAFTVDSAYLEVVVTR